MPPFRSSPHDAAQLEIVDAAHHLSTPQLALYAQRLGKVFASASTCYRYMRLRGWKRPLERLHFPPKEGIRASRPNEAWHVDETEVKLRDGTRLWIQAIIDNFSRFILAWRVSATHGAPYSLELLREAETSSAPPSQSLSTPTLGPPIALRSRTMSRLPHDAESNAERDVRERARRVAAMLNRWHDEDVSDEPDWDVEDITPLHIGPRSDAVSGS